MVLTVALVFFYFRDVAKYFLTWGDLQYRRKMARNEVKKCMEWLFQQQGEMEGQDYGQGHLMVTEAVSAHRNRSSEIRDFRSRVDKAMATEKLSEMDKKDLDSNFNSVAALSKKTEDCLQTVFQIAAMEDLIQGLSIEFDFKAQHLVNMEEAGRQRGDRGDTSLTISNESLARATQTCIQAVRTNWRWLSTAMQCVQVHLRNAAAYHEFFHEAEEAEYWMNSTLSRIHLTFDRSKLQGNRADAVAILSEIKDVLSAFLQWQTKTDYLFDKAKSIVPVPMRSITLTEERPVIALTDFSNNQITFIEGEVLFLMDNADRKKWKVRNNAGEIGVVPAVIILIPAPYIPAADTALRLRRQLLALWTGSIKRLGYQLIAFMLLVFRDWNDEEVKMLQQLTQEQRIEMLRVLHYLENTLKTHWQDYGDFQELQERIHRLIMIIEESIPGQESESSFVETVVVQIRTLEDLMKKYKDFWTFWETYKTIVELVKQPELLLVCDKWEQLRYVATAHVVKFWDTNLDLTEGDMTKQTASLALQEVSTDHLVSDVTIDEEHEDTTTETVKTTVTEEQHTFIIKGVLDPRDNQTQLDLQNAIMLGVVDQAKSLYVNPLTGETMTMKEAMNEGKVIIEFLSKRKLREERKSYGLITIKTTRDSRPYTIHGVKDPTSDEMLTVEEATARGVLDTHESSYCLATGETIPLLDAIDKGLLDATYHSDDHHPAKHDVISKTYAVHGVVDQRRKTKVSFSDAIIQGLLDRETGDYINNLTLEKVPVQQAIMRGFLKARRITDTSKLDIDPRNQIIIQKFENARQKLMREIHTIRMFKAMAKQRHARHQ